MSLDWNQKQMQTIRRMAPQTFPYGSRDRRLGPPGNPQLPVVSWWLPAPNWRRGRSGMSWMERTQANGKDREANGLGG
jgi:hypothetical protein